MEIDDLQREVAKFVKDSKLETEVETRLLDLTSEVGELAKEGFETTDDWTNELGDVLFALICVANKTDVNLETALNKALAKYQKRFEEKGEVSSGN